MDHPEQKIVCAKCEGYKRVAMVKSCQEVPENLCNKPLPMIFSKARDILQGTVDGDARMTDFKNLFIAGFANKNLTTTDCPWCNATGVSHILRQLTPEEHAAYLQK